MRKFFVTFGLGLLVVSSTGCTSFRFKRAWREADPSERWAGEWKSSKSSHGGQLRAVVSNQPAAKDLEVYFEAHWHGFVTAYPAHLQQEAGRKKQPRKVHGEHDLKACLGGGVYRYSGELSESEFKVNYISGYDQGTFVLRPSR
jgi:hypothetical protein